MNRNRPVSGTRSKLRVQGQKEGERVELVSNRVFHERTVIHSKTPLPRQLPLQSL